MNNYYILTKDAEANGDDAMLSGESPYLWGFHKRLVEGNEIEIDQIRLPINFKVHENNLRGRMTDNLYLEQVDGLVVSVKSKELLLNKNGNLQFMPFIIVDDYSNFEEVQIAKYRNEKLDYNSITYDSYYIANVIGLIDCVDHKASDIEYYVPKPDIPDDLPDDMKEAMQQEEDNDIDFIRKLVLDESKIPEDIKIFRLKDCPRILVFKEEIVQAIREAKLTGFVFVPLEEYTDEIPDDTDDDDEETGKAAETKKVGKNPAAEKVMETPAEAEPRQPQTGRGIVIKARRNS